mgnify:CR=1 FL=1
MGTSWIIEGTVDPRWPINTRGNVGEVFPEVLTPLSYRLGVIAAEKAWRDAYAARYEIEPPGPGHLGRVAAIRDRLPDTASAATEDAAATEGPALVATDAGGIWVPQGWRLSPTAAGYLLENRA